ncbi:transposase [Streptomyces sp. SR27]|uniref:transposase n=1 Tax=Streptomyces sp. SR27 TaxID=3076630 RepID=UPI003FA3BC41
MTGGNTNDCTRFTAMMEAIRVPRIRPGRPRIRPDHVLGGKGYSQRAFRTWLRRRGIPHTIPERADQVRNRARRGSRGGRPPAARSTSSGNVVGRCFNRLKQWRGIATPYDKTAESFEAAVTPGYDFPDDLADLQVRLHRARAEHEALARTLPWSVEPSPAGKPRSTGRPARSSSRAAKRPPATPPISSRRTPVCAP